MKLEEHENNRVLIVDDQKEIHDDFVEMLTSSSGWRATDHLATTFLDEEDKSFLPNFELLHARGGEEACMIINTAKESDHPVAVAYIDVRMPPGIDGTETVRRIRKIDRDIEIIIMTAYADKSLPEIVHAVELLHKTLYIRKPFAREEIQQLTISLVGKWNIEQALTGQQRKLAASYRRLEAVLNATGDAMAMYDTDGRLEFANQGYADLFDMAESELNGLSADEIAARVRERFAEPTLPDMEGGFLLADDGTKLEEARDGVPKQRLFYRSTAPVQDGREDVIGNLFVYRDVSKEIEIEQMKAEVMRLRNALETTYSFAGIVGDSPPMRQVYALMEQAASSDITVLIRGESGTGKEMVAKSIHFSSARKKGPFLAINCAALPAGMIASELFGHEMGAFTGATQRRIGAFERARGGTIFLDEIGDMLPDLQANLLRVLQEKEIQRLGGSASLPVDVRVIAATNKDLEGEVATGGFREDLYYRIAAFPIAIPPLRERRGDIPLLASHFLEKHTERVGKSISGLSNAALRALFQYDWHGNVRELENAIERAVLLETADVLQVRNLPSQLSAAALQGDESAPASVLPLAEVERRALAHALEASGHNVAEAARGLKVNRATLYRKLKKHGLISTQ